MGRDNLLASSYRHGPDHGVVGVVRVGVYKDILQLFLGQQLCHRFCEHGFPGTGAADHHDMPALDRSLPDDFNCMLLADNLVDQLGRNLD